MPRKADLALLSSLEEVLVRAGGVGVTHVVQHSNREFGLVSSLASRLEATDTGCGGAIGGLDLVVVRSAGAEVLQLDIVKELAALRDGDLGRARGSAIVADQC